MNSVSKIVDLTTPEKFVALSYVMCEYDTWYNCRNEWGTW